MSGLEGVLPYVPVDGWEMTDSAFSNDGAFYYFQDKYWEMRVSLIDNTISFTRRGRKSKVSVEADEPVLLRAYGIMIHIKPCYDAGMKRSV